MVTTRPFLLRGFLLRDLCRGLDTGGESMGRTYRAKLAEVAFSGYQILADDDDERLALWEEAFQSIDFLHAATAYLDKETATPRTHPGLQLLLAVLLGEMSRVFDPAGEPSFRGEIARAVAHGLAPLPQRYPRCARTLLAALQADRETVLHRAGSITGHALLEKSCFARPDWLRTSDRKTAEQDLLFFVRYVRKFRLPCG